MENKFDNTPAKFKILVFLAVYQISKVSYSRSYLLVISEGEFDVGLNVVIGKPSRDEKQYNFLQMLKPHCSVGKILIEIPLGSKRRST